MPEHEEPHHTEHDQEHENGHEHELEQQHEQEQSHGPEEHIQEEVPPAPSGGEQTEGETIAASKFYTAYYFWIRLSSMMLTLDCDQTKHTQTVLNYIMDSA